MKGAEGVSPAREIEIRKLGTFRYRLNASQVLSCPRQQAFAFFKNPANLCDITPQWLSFCMLEQGTENPVRDGAEYNYTIRWLGFRIRWRSRIIEYHPPERFTDIQIWGPYRSWVHVHTFDPVPEGTLMKDEVTYVVPLFALPVHWLIRKQLIHIFTFRRERIEAWTRSIASEGDSGYGEEKEAAGGI